MIRETSACCAGVSSGVVLVLASNVDGPAVVLEGGGEGGMYAWDARVRRKRRGVEMRGRRAIVRMAAVGSGRILDAERFTATVKMCRYEKSIETRLRSVDRPYAAG